MTNGEKIRIAGIILSVFLLFVFITGLNSNSRKKYEKLETEEFALINAQTLVVAFNSIKNDTTGSIQSLVEDIKANYPIISSVSVIEGRKFAAHSDKNLVGKKIPKDLFDAQRELKKKFKSKEEDITSEEWTGEGIKSFLLTLPIVQNNKFVGSVGLKTAVRRIPPISNNILLWIIALILALLLILTDKFLAKIKLPLGIVLVVIITIISVSLVINGANSYIKKWEKEKGKIVSENFASMEKNGIPMAFTRFVNQVNLKVGKFSLINISDWHTQAVSSQLLSAKLAKNKKAGINTTIALSIFGIALITLIFLNLWEKFVTTIYKFRLAYAYITPAMLGVFLLVFFPFIYGFLIGFTDYGLNDFNKPLLEYFSNLGRYNFGNFIKILRDFNISDYRNFYFTLFHTIIWTIVNVTLHVSIGVFLALLLNNPKLKGRTAYRILLILPWAVPSYITALIWRGMFHKQFGAVNGLLNLLHIESISWFLNPITAFLANLATNVWLGFPFMMVIALGALQSIPKELYEAADIDGASRWQGFWNITFPLLKPAMIPSIILGVIWTFNQFNVIYLVSGGGPDGATEILITDAYRYAFEQYRYGYAAAYSIIIFFILMAFGIYTSKISKATQGVYE